jgi:hypothetical protein
MSSPSPSQRQQLRNSLLRAVAMQVSPYLSFSDLLSEGLLILSEELVLRRDLTAISKGADFCSAASVSPVTPVSLVTPRAARKEDAEVHFRQNGASIEDAASDAEVDEICSLLSDKSHANVDSFRAFDDDVEEKMVEQLVLDQSTAALNEDYGFDNALAADCMEYEKSSLLTNPVAQSCEPAEEVKQPKKKKPRLSVEESLAKQKEMLEKKQEKMLQQQQELQAKIEAKRKEDEEKARQKELAKEAAKKLKKEQKALEKEQTSLERAASKQRNKSEKKQKEKSGSSGDRVGEKRSRKTDAEDEDMFGFDEEEHVDINALDDLQGPGLGENSWDDLHNIPPPKRSTELSSASSSTEPKVAAAAGSSSFLQKAMSELSDDVDVVRKRTINGKIYLVSMKSLVYDLQENEVGKLDPKTGEVVFYKFDQVKKSSNSSCSSASESEAEDYF